MREIHVDEISEAVRHLCTEAASRLPEDVVGALRTARVREDSAAGIRVLDQILLNADQARAEMLPLCQDTGTIVIFLDVGQDVHITGGPVMEALTDGVNAAYRDGFLRAAMVDRPFSDRVNTRDGTPPVVHTEIVGGDRLRIHVMAKGCGGENASRFSMIPPGEGKQGITKFVLKAIEESAGNPCPPIIIGLGIGGTAEHAMYMATRALTRKIGEPNGDREESAFEAELLVGVNTLGIGPQSAGGRATALAVHIKTYPTHIASMPVAVNLQCHSARLKEAIL